MDRITLKTQLGAYRSPFEEENQFVPDFLALTEDPLAYSRERTAGHFTASAWIVNKERTHTLLTLHRKLGRWLQLGGHADGNENLLEVAMQEAREESGLTSLQFVDTHIFDLDKHIIPERPHVAEHFHFDVRYLIEAELQEPLVRSDESISLAWVTFDAVIDLIGYNPSILRMLEKNKYLRNFTLMRSFDIPQLRADFSFTTPIQLRFSDIDGYLHVNNGVYFSYFEHARAVFLYQVAGWDVLDVGTVVGRIEIDYIRPIHLTDQVEALVKCSRLGNSSFDLEQVLVGKDSTGNEQVYATCKSVLVSVDKSSMKPVAIPEAFRQKLASS